MPFNENEKELMVSSLFDCTQTEKHTRVRTPYLYPDGDYIDLFIRQDEGVYSISDLGETLRWLSINAATGKRTDRQSKLIADICLNHGVELFKGMLLTRASSQAELGAAITRLSQAALRVADIWFTFRTRAIYSINDEVAELFTDKDIGFTSRERIPGRSGKIWTPDFHTRTPLSSSFVYVLSTGSKGASRQIVNNVVAAWYDLSHHKIGPSFLNFISLFDDTIDVWADEDFNLLRELSDVARWSNPDEFLELLSRAA